MRRPDRWARVALLLVAFVLLAPALAERVVIDTGDDPNGRLELRTVVLPDGSEVELVVITAETVTVTIGERVLVGSHIEFDSTNNVARIVGFGSVSTATETLEGDDLVIELNDETFTGRDVLIVTDAIDVVGDSASRVPGQISVLTGSFSPCSRCSQTVQDYSFRAERLELFPGDRLIAYEVTLLVRDREVFGFPFMVLPLGPPDRQPRLLISQGTASERAQIELDLPYAAGPDAYGTYLFRYYADVAPGEGGFLEERLLGGAIDTSYLGGGLDHRFFTKRGRGALELFYLPSFLDPDATGGRTLPEYTVRFAFATETELGPPALDLLFERDDENREGLAEYTLRASNVSGGLRGSFLTQGFFVMRDGADASTPTFASRATPLRTFGQVNLTPEDLEPLRLGALRLERLELDSGVFEDISNSTNRSAASNPTAAAARLLEAHSLVLDEVSPGLGFSVSGRTDFVGKYYSTAERLIDWDTRLAALQRFGSAGTLSVTFTRDIAEGETPFRFDQIPLRNRTDLAASLNLTPLDWLSLEVASSYLFEDSRLRSAEGVQPIDTTLSLFANVSWVDLVFRNSYDVKEDDPGNIEIDLTLRGSGGGLTAEAQIQHIEDLKPEPQRLAGGIDDASETLIDLQASYDGLVTLEVEGGYRYRPPLTSEANEREYWQPLDLALTVGTPDQNDFLPSLRVNTTRDLNNGETTTFGYRATARLADLELSAEQIFNLEDGLVQRPTTGRYQATWPGLALFEASGFAIVQPQWLGFEAEEVSSEPWRFTLRDAPIGGNAAWQLILATNRTVDLEEGEVAFSNTTLQTNIELAQSSIGGVRYSLDVFAELALGDDSLETTFLRRGNLNLTTDIYGRVGVQGSLGYLGACCLDGELTRAQLQIDDFSVTVRVTDDLYLGALFDDIWDFTGNVPTQSPFNLQPTLFLALDRCCWALYGSWDTATGQIAIALTTPGGSDGFQEFIDTPLTLPGREETP